jgi:hypothetical protein
MEYYCHYCHDWFDTETCQSHFEGVHGQENVTFENLCKRLESLGGISTRDEVKEEEERSKKKSEFFETNNFRHIL